MGCFEAAFHHPKSEWCGHPHHWSLGWELGDRSGPPPSRLRWKPHRLGAQKAEHSPPASSAPEAQRPPAARVAGRASPPHPRAPRGRGQDKSRPCPAAPRGNQHNTARWPPCRRSPEGGIRASPRRLSGEAVPPGPAAVSVLRRPDRGGRRSAKAGRLRPGVKRAGSGRIRGGGVCLGRDWTGGEGRGRARRAGVGWGGQGREGQGRAWGGEGRARQGRAGPGRAGGRRACRAEDGPLRMGSG